MAKKAAKSNPFPSDAPGTGVAPKKTSVARAKKHLKAQASGVVAAVEQFVSAITNTTQQEVTPASEAPVVEAQVVDAPVVDAQVLEAVPVPAPPAVVTPAPEPVSENPAASAAETEKSDPKAVSKKVSEEEIRVLAYTFYLNRGTEGGSEAEDWLRAEQSLRPL